MTESLFTNVSIRQDTKARLRSMAKAEGRSISGLLALLINDRYRRWVEIARKPSKVAV